MGRPVDKSNPQVGTAGIRYHKTHSDADVSLSRPGATSDSRDEHYGSDIKGPKTLVTIPYKWRDRTTGKLHRAKTTAYIPDVTKLEHHIAPGYDEPWVITKDGTTYSRTDLRANEDGFAELLYRAERNQRGLYEPKDYASNAYDEEDAEEEVSARWLMSNPKKPYPIVTGDGRIWTKVTRR